MNSSALLQEYFGGMLITSELAELDDIENGLLDNTYQIGILNKPTESGELFCQRFVSEHLYISVPKTHRHADKEYVKFEDFSGERFLLFEHIGFWKDFCYNNLKETNFIIQNSMESLEELINATDFPCFTSNAFARTAAHSGSRVVIPIKEPEAYATFYIACLNSYKKKYAPFFNSIRSILIQK